MAAEEVELDGQRLTALNGGPLFKFNEAVSLQIFCESQQEVDRYWDKLTAGGDPKAQQCGWLKDKYGVSLAGDPDRHARADRDGSEGSERAMAAMLPMKKLDLAALERAYAG